MAEHINKKESRMLDNVCYLIAQNETGEYDSRGNPIVDETKTMRFCGELPVASSEYHRSGQRGIKPQKTLLLHLDEYEEEKHLEYGGNTFEVYRNYPRDDGLIELYLKEGISK